MMNLPPLSTLAQCRFVTYRFSNHIRSYHNEEIRKRYKEEYFAINYIPHKRYKRRLPVCRFGCLVKRANTHKYSNIIIGWGGSRLYQYRMHVHVSISTIALSPSCSLRQPAGVEALFQAYGAQSLKCRKSRNGIGCSLWQSVDGT